MFSPPPHDDLERRACGCAHCLSELTSFALNDSLRFAALTKYLTITLLHFFFAENKIKILKPFSKIEFR